MYERISSLSFLLKKEITDSEYDALSTETKKKYRKKLAYPSSGYASSYDPPLSSHYIMSSDPYPSDESPSHSHHFDGYGGGDTGGGGASGGWDSSDSGSYDSGGGDCDGGDGGGGGD